MKRILTILCLLSMYIVANAQSIVIPYGTTVYASTYWQKGTDDEYYVKKETAITGLNGSAIDVSQIYSYDKEGIAYVKGKYGNYRMLFTEYYNKQFKKQMKEYKVPRLKNDELMTKRNSVDSELETFFLHYNDSVRADKEEKARLARLEAERKAKEKRIQDSIATDNYRKTHDWRKYDHSVSLYCIACDETHYDDSIRVLSISADTLYYMRKEATAETLGYEFRSVHYAALKPSIKETKDFKDYVNMWTDSIAAHNDCTNLVARIINYQNYQEFENNVRKEAPYGYIKDWGWNLNSAAGIEINFEYFNTNKKTIKYIDFYFSVYNAVGDICPLMYQNGNVGHVRGVGPLESWESASWDWDNATHYTSYSASNMRVQKLVITYMDGTTKVIPKNQIVFND